MSDLKMSYAFSLPITTGASRDCCDEWETLAYDSVGDFMFKLPDDVDIELVVKAINAYDSNQELIAKYESQKKVSDTLAKQRAKLCKDKDLEIAKQAEQIELLQKTVERIDKLEYKTGDLEISLRHKSRLLASCESALVERDATIAKQQEQNEILRDALETVRRISSSVPVDKAILGVAVKALAATVEGS